MKWPHRLARSRTGGSQPSGRGSNPLGAIFVNCEKQTRRWMVTKKIIYVLVGSIFLFMGCEQINSLIGTPKKKKKEEVKKTSELPPIKGQLLARVNDWAIGTEDFKEKLKAFKALYPDLDINDPDTKKKLLEQLVNQQILAQEARRRGLDKEKDFIDALRETETRLLVQKMTENLSKDIVVTDVEVENFYNTYKSSPLFTEPKEIKVREIVVPTEEKAKEILIRLYQGESFASLATSYSIAKSAKKGGDLGYLKIDPTKAPKTKFPKFWEEVTSKEKGEISGYFKGPDGYYIIKVEDIRGGKIRPLDEKTKKQIRDLLKLQKLGKKLEDLIYKAKQNMNVVINEDLL